MSLEFFDVLESSQKHYSIFISFYFSNFLLVVILVMKCEINKTPGIASPFLFLITYYNSLSKFLKKTHILIFVLLVTFDDLINEIVTLKNTIIIRQLALN
jgi:hypothetical protein